MEEKLIFLTIIFLLISLGFLGYKQATTGFFVDKSIELKGGNFITISFSNSSFKEISSLRDKLQKKYGFIVYTTSNAMETQLSIECTNIDVKNLISDINNSLEIKNYEVSEIDPKLSDVVLRETVYAIIFAFVSIAIIIFILFRVPVPSFAVVLCAFSDIIETLFLMNIFGISLSIATFTGLLMMLGYSVDTDILLTTRTLKERVNFDKKYKSALKTGLTMSATSLVALLSILVVTGYTSVFGQLVSVLIIALLVDIPNTWIQNATILKIYLKKHGH